MGNVEDKDKQKELAVKAGLKQAEQLRKKKDYDGASQLLLDLLEQQCHTDQVLYYLGNTYFDGKDVSRAEYCYKRAIQENPEHVNAMHNLAVALKKQGKIGESVQLMKKVRLLELKGVKTRSLLEEAPSKEMVTWSKRIGLRIFAFTVLFFILIVLFFRLI